MGRPPLGGCSLRDRSASAGTARFRKLVLLSILSAGLASAVHGEDRGRFEVFFGGGLLSAEGGFAQHPAPGLGGSEEIAATLGAGDGFLFGAAIGIHRAFAVEFSYAHFTNDYVVDLYGMNTQIGEWGYLTAEHSTSLGHLGMSLVWNVELGPVVPYLSGGVGWMMFIDAAAFSPHGAIGCKYFPFPGKHVGLRLDARVFQAHLEDNVDASLGPWGGTYADARYEDDFTFKDVVAGLIVRF